MPQKLFSQMLALLRVKNCKQPQILPKIWYAVGGKFQNECDASNSITQWQGLISLSRTFQTQRNDRIEASILICVISFLSFYK